MTLGKNAMTLAELKKSLHAGELRIVPAEPTVLMIEAGSEANPTVWNDGTDAGFADDVANDVYRAMLARCLLDSLDASEVMRLALEAQTTYIGELLSGARSDIALADPADVGMSGVPIVAWRKAYFEGCKDMAEGIVSRMPAEQQEAAVASVRAAVRAALQSIQSQEPAP